MNTIENLQIISETFLYENIYLSDLFSGETYWFVYFFIFF